jgi:hypothetical protein
VRKAEADYRAAEKVAAGSDPLLDQACFHCQECSEKYLKAVSEEAGVHGPKDARPGSPCGTFAAVSSGVALARARVRFPQSIRRRGPLSRQVCEQAPGRVSHTVGRPRARCVPPNPGASASSATPWSVMRNETQRIRDEQFRAARAIYCTAAMLELKEDAAAL